MLPRVNWSLTQRFDAPAVKIGTVPTATPQVPSTPAKSDWATHVRNTYQRLKGSDAKTTYKMAMVEASASWKQ